MHDVTQTWHHFSFIIAFQSSNFVHNKMSLKNLVKIFISATYLHSEIHHTMLMSLGHMQISEAHRNRTKDS